LSPFHDGTPPEGAAAISDFGLLPYPEVRDPKAPSEFLFDPKKKDMPFVRRVLEAFPTMEEASASRHGDRF
jgi:hypothetical protein